MLVHKSILTLKPVIDNDKFSNIFITKEKTFATDGCMLIVIKNPDQEIQTEYPSAPGNIDDSNVEYIALNKVTLNKIEKNLPAKPLAPILNNFVVRKKGERTIEIFITDLDNNIEITQRDAEVKPPNIDTVFERIKDSEYVNVYLNLENLNKIISIFKKIQKLVKLPSETTVVKVSIPTKEENSPVVIQLTDSIEGQGIDKIEATAVLMPSRKK